MVEKDFGEKLQKKGKCTLLSVHTKPGSKEFAVGGFDKWTGSLEVRLREKPEKGKANYRLKKELEKIFQARVKIVSGQRSRQKTLLVFAPKAQVEKCLSTP
jgi:uncharacterized protein (TIGR00251 family)